FRRLSVFQGTFSLLAAESVGAGGGTGRKDVVGLLAGLGDKSLIQGADRRARHRYRLAGTRCRPAPARPAGAGAPGTRGGGRGAPTRGSSWPWPGRPKPG